jgi:transposase-like protein
MPSPEFRRRAVELARRGDKPLLRLAKDLRISRSCLYSRLKQPDADAKLGTRYRRTSAIKKKLAELRRRNKQLQTEDDILQRAAHFALGKRSPGAIYSLARVAVACRVLQVSALGYYDWLGRPGSPCELRDEQLTEMIRQIHADSRGRYGLPRVHAHLRLELGVEVNDKHVERHQRDAGPEGVHRRKLVNQDSRECAVQRPSDAEAPDQLRAIHSTEAPSAEGQA